MMHRLVSAHFVGFCILLLGINTVCASDKETRVFQVLIDDKPAGQFTLQQQRDGQGLETVSIQTHVSYKQYLMKYKYDLQTTEEWLHGKLVKLHAFTNDDGTKTTVQVVKPGSVFVNGAKRQLDDVPFTMTGWRLPPGIEKTASFSALDAETGQVVPVQITAEGAVQVTVAGRLIPGKRYRMIGKDVDAELWFDAEGKLVGSIRKEDGHRVTLTLAAIQP